VQKSSKVAWVWLVKEEYLKDYVAMHTNPWPEVLEEHSRAGIVNYSIFRTGRQFFYCFECDDPEAAFAYLANSPICKRWNAITSRMIEGSFDFKKDEPVPLLEEVFYLQ
jgi:L-rhamnose mutarotase